MIGEIIGGLAGGLGGLFGGGSSGGLPKWLKGEYKELAGNVGNIAPRQFFPGQTHVGALPSELAAFGSRDAFNQGMFGPGGLYSSILNSAQSQLTGGSGGQMSQALSPFATSSLMNSFGQGPGQVGRYGFDTSIDPAGMAPAFGRAGSLDATGALNSMLSGTPDYAGVQGSIDAANAPILRQLNEDIIPGLNQRATFLNNPTGGIKTLNRVLPEVGQRMSENALSITEGERQRALGAQRDAAGMISQGGLQSFGLGLQGALGQADLQRALAGQNLQTDTTNAGLGSQFRSDVLGLGGLAGNLAGQQDSNAARIAAMFPSLLQAGQQPSQDAMNYGAFQRMLAEQGLQGEMNRFNFQQNEPYDRYGFQAGIFSQLAPGAQQQPQGSSALGAIGGALTGMGLGSSIAQMFGGGNQFQPQQFDINSLFTNPQPINPAVLG